MLPRHASLHASSSPSFVRIAPLTLLPASQGLSDVETEQRLDAALTIFRYVHDKDVFESYYKSSLARRLLSGRSVSDDVERSVVTRLKAKCGYMFTNRLEGMFNDMRIRCESMECYRRECRARGGTRSGAGVEMGVDVLTTGYWRRCGPRRGEEEIWGACGGEGTAPRRLQE